jgi:hypothetical protein
MHISQTLTSHTIFAEHILWSYSKRNISHSLTDSAEEKPDDEEQERTSTTHVALAPRSRWCGATTKSYPSLSPEQESPRSSISTAAAAHCCSSLLLSVPMPVSFSFPTNEGRSVSRSHCALPCPSAAKTVVRPYDLPQKESDINPNVFASNE